MKNLILTFFLIGVLFGFSYAQDEDTISAKKWEFSADMNMYFYPGEFIGMPVIRADRDKLHLEARYNYEDSKTFSAWLGYNFAGGNELSYFITPMLGGVVGNTKGIAPGLEFTFEYKGFELYNESEYMVDVDSKLNNFLYTWTDFSYAPTDWLWAGLSAQTLQMYQEKTEFEGGFLLGGGISNFELTGYLFNPGSDNHYWVLLFTVNF
ncbi:MAG: hypothetical protein JXR31_12910 [Prolixibacteraceae bacterium]|nr:hypothetical protein [Prolixibacteraceae bacterium]MBN2775149.1 hypothetical protein [Prolixibacteraceae bacterium]